MYKTLRIIRIIVALAAMLAPAVALVGGWDSVFGRMQIMMAIVTGTSFWLLVWLVVTFIYGRLYCSTICPLGTLQDCVSTLWRALAPRRIRGRYHWRPPMSRLRLTVLVVVISCMFCGWLTIPLLFDPYSTYARIIEQFVTAPVMGRGPAVPFALSTFSIAFAGAAVTVAFSLRRGRLLCNTLCPVGTLLGAVSTRSIYHTEINPDKCINCGECERVCKAECIRLTEHTVDVSRCVVCFKCMSVCPNDAITYRAGRHRLQMPLMQPTLSARLAAPDSDNSITNETISPTAERHPRARH